jgi:hypothetical protein
MPKKTNIFSKLLKQAQLAGHIVPLTKASLKWVRSAAADMRASPKKLISEGKTTFKPEIGSFYLYEYDPKMKEILPYYDKYPVVVIIDMYEDGFLGLNFHYLDYFSRSALLDALYSATDITDKNARIALSYQILKNASKFSNFIPCLKRYLYSHIRSPMLTVTSEKWDILCFLPLQKFVKASPQTVYSDSLQKIHAHKKKNVWYRKLWKKFSGKK